MITCVMIVLLAPILFEATLQIQLPIFFFCTFYIHDCVVKHWKYFRTGYERSGETNDDRAVIVSALHYAFGDHVSY